MAAPMTFALYSSRWLNHVLITTSLTSANRRHPRGIAGKRAMLLSASLLKIAQVVILAPSCWLYLCAWQLHAMAPTQVAGGACQTSTDSHHVERP